VVSFSIHLLGHPDGIGGTIHHADLTTLASLNIYHNSAFSFCHTMLFYKSISNVIILKYLLDCYWTGLPELRIFGIKTIIPGWDGPCGTGLNAFPAL
jgi:hypothetical protein